MKLKTLAHVAGAVFSAATLLASPLAQAQEWPTQKPIKLIAVFPPGGSVDQVARILAPALQNQLKQNVIVENIGGASGSIGTAALAKAAPDGYSLVMATFAHAVNPSLQAKLPYSNDHSFAPVALIGRGPNVLVVRAGSPFKSVADVIAAAKAQPGQLTYASQGNGTSAHLAGEMFNNLAKVEMTHIPYRGAGPAMTDVLGGQVDMIFGTAAAVSPLLASGKMRALAVTSAAPSPAFQGIPTIAQTIPDYAVESWYGLYAPASTPAAVIDTLSRAAKQAALNPDFIKKMEQEGLTVMASSPLELDAYVKNEQTRWHKIISENKIQLN
mgnify:CR=1 FL=1